MKPRGGAAKRFLLGAAAAAIVAAIGTAAWMYLSPRGLAGHAIERHGSAATRTSVRLERIEISPGDGTCSITGFTVGNPRGFRTPAAFSADSIKLALDPATLGKEVLVVRALSVTSPRLSYESGDAGSNFEVLLGNILRHAGESAGAGSQGPKLIVERLVVHNAALSYASALTAGKTVTIALPDIRLSGIGRVEGGVTPGRFAQALVEAMLDRIRRAMSLEAMRGGAK